MDDKDYIELLEAALIDMLDGQYCWYEIRDQTGCSDERSQEIESFFGKTVMPNYLEKHNLK